MMQLAEIVPVSTPIVLMDLDVYIDKYRHKKGSATTFNTVDGWTIDQFVRTGGSNIEFGDNMSTLDKWNIMAQESAGTSK